MNRNWEGLGMDNPWTPKILTHFPSQMRSNMCCPCFTIFFGFVFIISGFQLEFYASQELEEVKALRPELEFDYLGEVCKVRIEPCV